MDLGEVIATYDVASALRGEVGQFEITIPTGETRNVTCKPNHSISKMEWPVSKVQTQPFLIRKLAEPILDEPVRKSLVPVGQRSSQLHRDAAPFMLENRTENIEPSPELILCDKPLTTRDSRPDERARRFELLYVEENSRSSGAAACVYLANGEQNGARTQEFITTSCSTFNELDFQIRRLHAELDEIRSRARNKFYRTQAVSSGA